MKKILFSLSAVAMLGLVACSGNGKGGADTASLDSPAVDTTVAIVEETEVAVDTNNEGEPTAVEVAQEGEAVEVATPAAEKAE